MRVPGGHSPEHPALVIAVDHSDAAYAKCGVPAADIDAVRAALVAAARLCLAAEPAVDMLVVRPEEARSWSGPPHRVIVGLPDVLPDDRDELRSMVDLAASPRAGVLKVGWQLGAEAGDDRLSLIFDRAAVRRVGLIFEPYLDLVDSRRAASSLRELQGHPAYVASKLDADGARRLAADGTLTAPLFLRSAGMAFDDFRRSLSDAARSCLSDLLAGAVVGAAVWNDCVPALARSVAGGGAPPADVIEHVSDILSARARSLCDALTGRDDRGTGSAPEPPVVAPV